MNNSHIQTTRSVEVLILILLTVSSHGQSTFNKKKISPHDAYFGLSFGPEFDYKSNFFFSMEYAFVPGIQKKYFIGAGYYASIKEKESSGSYSGHSGKFHDDTNIGSLFVSQKLFFESNNNRVKPYVGFNAGVRTFSQEYYFTYKQQPPPFAFLLFPLVLVNSEQTINIFETNQNCFTSTFSGGFKFQLDNIGSITTDLQFRTSQSFKSYQGDRKSFIAAFSLGLQIGWKKRIRKNNSSPKTTHPNKESLVPLF